MGHRGQRFLPAHLARELIPVLSSGAVSAGRGDVEPLVCFNMVDLTTLPVERYIRARRDCPWRVGTS